ncbi:MAG: pyridoxamine 5'-phosphate oxidase family protein [Methanospirillum sp.]|nr:pyridoxamine 5'-phosphate oxidase family protein [Methanospirillum sp.]
MKPVKIPRVPKKEYDDLIRRQYVSRIAFGACDHPYVAPFLYVFDEKHLFFLPTRYGRKIEYFRTDPRVSVEIEEYAPDLSSFEFVSLQGVLREVEDPAERLRVREKFAAMISGRNLSPRVLTALGHDAGDPLEAIVREERTLVWRLSDVRDIVALRNG